MFGAGNVIQLVHLSFSAETEARNKCPNSERTIVYNHVIHKCYIKNNDQTGSSSQTVQHGHHHHTPTTLLTAGGAIVPLTMIQCATNQLCKIKIQPTKLK